MCGDLSVLAGKAGYGAVGYGLTGQLVAAAAAARCGQNGAFIRTRPKHHGTKKRFDGALSAGDVKYVYCRTRELDECIQALEALNLAPIEIALFDSLVVDNDFSDLGDIPDLPPAGQVTLEDAVLLLRGEFTLSSGKRTGHYWETLPAANTFSIARRLNVPGRERMIVGVGHGGAYLSAVTALARAKQPLVVDPDGVQAAAINQRSVLLDDFVTTGTAFDRSLAALSRTAREQSQCLSLYALLPVRPGTA